MSQKVETITLQVFLTEVLDPSLVLISPELWEHQNIDMTSKYCVSIIWMIKNKWWVNGLEVHCRF